MEAAECLALGGTGQEAADAGGIALRTIRRWNTHPDFVLKVQGLTFTVGLASRANRVRLINRAIQAKIEEDGTVNTKADLLDLLKLMIAETDGIKLDELTLSALFAGLGGLTPPEPPSSQ